MSATTIVVGVAVVALLVGLGLLAKRQAGPQLVNFFSNLTEADKAFGLYILSGLALTYPAYWLCSSGRADWALLLGLCWLASSFKVRRIEVRVQQRLEEERKKQALLNTMPRKR